MVSNRVGDQYEKLVSRSMAVEIIDRLEAVDIDKSQV